MKPFNPLSGLEAQRSRRARHAENSTRLAWSYGSYTSVGWGEKQFEDAHMFEVAFTEMPWVSYAYSLDPDADEEQELIDTRYPRATGFVYEWLTNSRGMYLGALCAATVLTQDFYLPTTEVDDPNYQLVHFFTFTGIAMKDVATGQNVNDLMM